MAHRDVETGLRFGAGGEFGRHEWRNALRLLRPTLPYYDRPLEVGEDLMCFEIGQTVSVKRPPVPSSQSSSRRAQ